MPAAHVTFTPFLRHWYDRGAVPFAKTVKVAACPTVTGTLCGPLVIVGANAEPTVRIAYLLVVDKPPVVTTTEKTLPLQPLDRFDNDSSAVPTPEALKPLPH